MRGIRLITAAMALVALTMSGGAYAFGPLIYDNGAPNLASGNEMTFWLQTEDFMLSGNATLGGVKFWTLEAANATYDGTVEWFVFGDSSGNPGAIVGNGIVNPTKTSTGQVWSQGALYESVYSFDTSPVGLSANTPYHLGLHVNSTRGYNSRDEIYWESTNANATGLGIESYNGTMSNWVRNSNEHAYQLYGPGTTGAVPEPYSASLALVGLATIGGLRRRR